MTRTYALLPECLAVEEPATNDLDTIACAWAFESNADFDVRPKSEAAAIYLARGVRRLIADNAELLAACKDFANMRLWVAAYDGRVFDRARALKAIDAADAAIAKASKARQ